MDDATRRTVVNVVFVGADQTHFFGAVWGCVAMTRERQEQVKREGRFRVACPDWEDVSKRESACALDEGRAI